MRVVRLPQTYVDLVDIAAFLGQDDPAVAVRFYDCYERSLSTLKKNPKAGSSRHSRMIGEVRIWFVSGFEKVLILYKESRTEITILRLIHASRDYTRFI